MLVDQRTWPIKDMRLETHTLTTKSLYMDWLKRRMLSLWIAWWSKHMASWIFMDLIPAGPRQSVSFQTHILTIHNQLPTCLLVQKPPAWLAIHFRLHESHEPRKKTHFPLYWLFNIDPYSRLLSSPYNCVVQSPKKSQTTRAFFIAHMKSVCPGPVSVRDPQALSLDVVQATGSLSKCLSGFVCPHVYRHISCEYKYIYIYKYVYHYVFMYTRITVRIIYQ